MLQIKTETSGLMYSRLKGWTARVDKMVNDFKNKTEGCALRQLVIESLNAFVAGVQVYKNT